MRINVGCGLTPTPGWKNFDNSLSIRISGYPLIADMLLRLPILAVPQKDFIRFAKTHAIEYGDIVHGLHVQDGCAEVLYASHVFEHLDREDAGRFLEEAWRILSPGGILRLAIPDIRKQVERYLASGDADQFVSNTHMCVPRPKTVMHRLRYLLTGPRHHQWMYDGRSLASFVARYGFVRIEVLGPGETRIADSAPLDVCEREDESVYLEAEKPCSV